MAEPKSLHDRAYEVLLRCTEAVGESWKDGEWQAATRAGFVTKDAKLMSIMVKLTKLRTAPTEAMLSQEVVRELESSARTESARVRAEWVACGRPSRDRPQGGS